MHLLYFSNASESPHHPIKVEALLPGRGDAVEIAKCWLKNHGHTSAKDIL